MDRGSDKKSGSGLYDRRFWTAVEVFLSPYCFQISLVVLPLLGLSGRDVRPTTYLCLVPRLTMREAILPLGWDSFMYNVFKIKRSFLRFSLRIPKQGSLIPVHEYGAQRACFMT